jgi:LmbE family N-acetylglucosaminyl deacetylase
VAPAIVLAAGVTAVLAPVLTAALVRRRHYRALCGAPSARDDRIVGGAGHDVVDVTLDRDGFEPPRELAAEGQTAFLTLTVRATVAGAWTDPFIEITDGGRRFRQYFDRGAAGRRHLNLSPVFQHRGTPLARVGLRGHALTWKAPATLSLFPPPPLANARLLVLAPHPDDAEIACFGLYADHHSWIVSLTAGEAGTPDLSGVLPSPADRAAWCARLRVWNSLTVPRLGGVPAERCLNLAYPDGRLQAMWRAPTQAFALACEPAMPRAALRAENTGAEFKAGAAGCTWTALVDDLRRVLDVARPDVVVAPHPTKEEHPDHVFTTVALDQALRASGARPRLLLYAVHGGGSRLFPFGPATALASLPPGDGPDWIGDGIYSHALSPERRLAKYFAVDASNDLRVYTSGAPTARELLRGIRRRISALVTGVGLDPGAHQRRAPRPDEIYYLADTQALSALVARALAKRADA